MRKVVLGLAISLDGFIEGPNGEYDWCFTDQDYGMTDFLSRIDALLMGRKTYEVVAAQGDVSPWKGMMTYVFSGTLRVMVVGTSHPAWLRKAAVPAHGHAKSTSVAGVKILRHRPGVVEVRVWVRHRCRGLVSLG